MFSYARNSCYRNHRRYTLCGFHHTEGREGRWQDCADCRDAFETEMYVYYGTNEYNFEKVSNPPAFEPTHCHQCGRIISLGEDGYSMAGGDYFCERCSAERMGGGWIGHRLTIVEGRERVGIVGKCHVVLEAGHGHKLRRRGAVSEGGGADITRLRLGIAAVKRPRPSMGSRGLGK